ncbi:MAG: CoA transferase, partial [Devosia sp.]|nr:CoA transferase [Devosia sp.]
AERIAAQSSDHWATVFAGDDFCVEIVRDLGEAVDAPHFAERGIFARQVRLANGQSYPALPLPVVPAFLTDAPAAAPALGEMALADAAWPVAEKD